MGIAQAPGVNESIWLSVVVILVTMSAGKKSEMRLIITITKEAPNIMYDIVCVFSICIYSVITLRI